MEWTNLVTAVLMGRLDAEPNADVSHIGDPDGHVEVESVTERELP